MAIKIGDKIPSAKLRHMTAEGPKEIGTDEIFKGKKVVLFAVPGAFTPTCSAKHLPGFVRQSRRAQGQGRRHHRLHLGQRRLRHGRLGQGRRAPTTR